MGWGDQVNATVCRFLESSLCIHGIVQWNGQCRETVLDGDHHPEIFKVNYTRRNPLVPGIV